MAFLRFLTAIFLFPGNLVLGQLDVSVEEDEGMFRSMINMLFWGFIAVICALPWMFGAGSSWLV